MTVQSFIEQGGTLVVDPTEATMTPDEFLARYGNIVDTICIVAKSEAGSTYYPSSTAPKDPMFGEFFTSFAQIANDIGIQVYAQIHGNMDGFFSRDPNFQMQRSGGMPLENYVCPNQETYWAYLAEIASEVSNKVTLEGIILKDILYPRDIACFCENCRRSFSTQAGIDRDYALDQIKRVDNVHSQWQAGRINALRGMISTVVNRVHQERKVNIISEILLDPETNYLPGAAEHFAQDLGMVAQISSHVLLHLHPWSPLPESEEDLLPIYRALEPIIDRKGQLTNSLYIYGPTEQNFEAALMLKNKLVSTHIFFTESQPRSYLNRRTLHLDLGV
ncbi:MAG: hypothetical protein ACW98K_12775 [Candidatus Kariarchaeaceae archaeon]|jgi:hypothetical protein